MSANVYHELKARTEERRAAGLIPEAYPVESPNLTRPRFTLPVCPLRGEPTGETRPCPTCSGTVQVKLFACPVHTACTEAKLIPGVQCCRICTDRPS